MATSAISVPVSENNYWVTLDRIKDGDTIVGHIHMDWDITLRFQSIRMVDYDAWESSKIRRSVNVTDEEVRKGKLATIELREHLRGKVLMISPRGRDNYGRLLGKIWTVENNKKTPIASFMKQQGHIRN